MSNQEATTSLCKVVNAVIYKLSCMTSLNAEFLKRTICQRWFEHIANVNDGRYDDENVKEIRELLMRAVKLIKENA